MNTPSHEICNIPELTQRTMGDDQFFCEVVRVCLTNLPVMIENLAGAMLSGDSEKVSLYAHTIKGMAGNLALHRLYEAALVFELSARSGDLGDALQQLKGLQFHCREAETALSEILEMKTGSARCEPIA